MPTQELVFIGERVIIGAVLIAAAGMVAAAALASLLRRDRQRLGPPSRRCCRALRVPRTERGLVGRIARGIGANGPIAVLVSRGCFDAAVQRYRPTPAEARRLDEVRRRVFD